MCVVCVCTDEGKQSCMILQAELLDTPLAHSLVPRTPPCQLRHSLRPAFMKRSLLTSPRVPLEPVADSPTKDLLMGPRPPHESPSWNSRDSVLHGLSQGVTQFHVPHGKIDTPHWLCHKD